jgi:hypothetical protein
MFGLGRPDMSDNLVWNLAWEPNMFGFGALTRDEIETLDMSGLRGGGVTPTFHKNKILYT